jgi:hypothetical protein
LEIAVSHRISEDIQPPHKWWEFDTAHESPIPSSLYRGRWVDEHVGVKAPGSENTATVRPLKMSSELILTQSFPLRAGHVTLGTRCREIIDLRTAKALKSDLLLCKAHQPFLELGMAKCAESYLALQILQRIAGGGC